MRKEMVTAVRGSQVYTSSGRKQAIGNKRFKVGEFVFVEGSYVFGHEPMRNNQVYIPQGNLVYIESYIKNYYNAYRIVSYTPTGKEIIQDNLDVPDNSYAAFSYGEERFSLFSFGWGSIIVKIYEKQTLIQSQEIEFPTRDWQPVDFYGKFNGNVLEWGICIYNPQTEGCQLLYYNNLTLVERIDFSNTITAQVAEYVNVTEDYMQDFISMGLTGVKDVVRNPGTINIVSVDFANKSLTTIISYRPQFKALAGSAPLAKYEAGIWEDFIIIGDNPTNYYIGFQIHSERALKLTAGGATVLTEHAYCLWAGYFINGQFVVANQHLPYNVHRFVKVLSEATELNFDIIRILNDKYSIIGDWQIKKALLMDRTTGAQYSFLEIIEQYKSQLHPGNLCRFAVDADSNNVFLYINTYNSQGYSYIFNKSDHTFLLIDSNLLQNISLVGISPKKAKELFGG